MSKLGKGMFGTVYGVNKDVARKEFTKFVEDDIDALSYHVIEAVTLQLLKGLPHIIQLHKIEKIRDGCPLSFTMDRHCYSLYDMLKEKDWDIQKVIGQLLIAVHQIHSIGIAHRDITLSNVLMDKNDDIVLCDFGSSMLTDIGGNDICYTAETTNDTYMPFYKMGLNLIDKKVTLAADMWSCGIVALRLVFKDSTVLGHTASRLDDGPQKDAIRNMLERDYKKYKSADEILALPYFNGFNAPEITPPQRAAIQKTPGFNPTTASMLCDLDPQDKWTNRKVACLGLATNLFRMYYNGQDNCHLSNACMHLSMLHLIGIWTDPPEQSLGLSNEIAKKSEFNWMNLVPQLGESKTWTTEEVYDMFGIDWRNLVP